ncbi:hypothetical protein [Geminisphaera colitermitum]|uniref:hypothetical protein n=1 Tax=Geminisphaera colitermitum TaxID=1148786 RepID=UPI000158D62F|nr:hypothetical protein [Geminisphaera colitermitum]
MNTTRKMKFEVTHLITSSFVHRASLVLGVTILTCSAVPVALPLAQAATIVPDVWYSATSSGIPVTGGVQFTTNDGTADAVRHVLTYFTSASLSNVGDSVSLSLKFSATFTGTPSTWGANLFGFGLYDSGGSRISANNLGATGGTGNPFSGYTGYRVAVRPRVTTTQSPFDGGLRVRTGTSATLGNNGAHTEVTGGGVGGIMGTARTFVSGTEYDVTYTITRTDASTLSISFGIGGLSGYSHTWSVASTYTTFDTFAITLSNQNIFDSITLTDVNISSNTFIPEPKTMAALLGLGVLMIAIGIRRAW